MKRDGTERKRATDTEWVIHIESKTSKYSFSTAEETDFLTLNFESATLESDTPIRSESLKEVQANISTKKKARKA